MESKKINTSSGRWRARMDATNADMPTVLPDPMLPRNSACLPSVASSKPTAAPSRPSTYASGSGGPTYPDGTQTPFPSTIWDA